LVVPKAVLRVVLKESLVCWSVAWTVDLRAQLVYWSVAVTVAL